ncbi:MAG: hypothetical protein IPJ65_38960 [Archangiaceae bacterium]|nr:hypothetical protein [Archangiaceae bacterium]
MNTPPRPASRTRRLWQRRWRKLRGMGWAGWVVVARRLAPWALLIFVTVQVKALSDRVRQVEDTEFSKLQAEVHQLATELGRLRTESEAMNHELVAGTEAMQSVNATLQEARREAPALTRLLAQVKTELPAAEAARRLSESLSTATGQLAQTEARLDELEAKLPASTQAAAMAAALEQQQRKLDALGQALPKSEQAQALARQLEANLASASALKASLPSEEQLQALKAEVTKARERVARVDAEAPKVATSPRAVEPSRPGSAGDEGASSGK